MRVVVQRDIHSQPTALEGVRHLAVYADDDHLLALMWEREDGTTALTRAGEPDFAALVDQMDLKLRSDVKCVKL